MALYQNPEFQEDWRNLFFHTHKHTKKKRQKIIFSNVLETLDSDRGPWDLDLSAKMETLDPSRAEIFIMA